MKKFTKFAWAVLGYNLIVILWGAFVRATGSGAGCGAHWPLCNGVVIPRSPQLETLAEFSHRVTSGIVLILVILLLIFAFRSFPKGHRVRKAAVFSLIFTITEALIGAGLVLFELVADNQSIARAFSMSAHLVNTFLLLAWLTLTAFWSRENTSASYHWSGKSSGFIVLGFIGLLVLGVSGAITALGDTLFPAQSLVEGFQQDFSETAHFLIRLRIYHPIIAIVVGGYIAILGYLFKAKIRHPLANRFGTGLIALVGLQLGLGVINVVLLAPVWMQLIHLLVSDFIWITYVLYADLFLRFGLLSKRITN